MKGEGYAKKEKVFHLLKTGKKEAMYKVILKEAKTKNFGGGFSAVWHNRKYYWGDGQRRMKRKKTGKGFKRNKGGPARLGASWIYARRKKPMLDRKQDLGNLEHRLRGGGRIKGIRQNGNDRQRGRRYQKKPSR